MLWTIWLIWPFPKYFFSPKDYLQHATSSAEQPKPGHRWAMRPWLLPDPWVIRRPPELAPCHNGSWFHPQAPVGWGAEPFWLAMVAIPKINNPNGLSSAVNHGYSNGVGQLSLSLVENDHSHLLDRQRSQLPKNYSNTVGPWETNRSNMTVGCLCLWWTWNCRCPCWSLPPHYPPFLSLFSQVQSADPSCLPVKDLQCPVAMTNQQRPASGGSAPTCNGQPSRSPTTSTTSGARVCRAKAVSVARSSPTSSRWIRKCQNIWLPIPGKGLLMWILHLMYGLLVNIKRWALQGWWIWSC